MSRPARQILIAEDSPTQAQHLRHILEQEGYRVTTAPNGVLALEAARRERPALIVSDVVMPEMTGYELCRRIKQDPQLKDVPVVLVTTLSDPEDVIRGLECGADNFILKPYDTGRLLRRMELVLANRPAAPDRELEVAIGGQRHPITADRGQILNLLLSTYEAAMERNSELSTTRDALRRANLELQQLTQALEDRVRERTRELERSNEQLRQAQQTLIQQERLRALGQMASGIAHDINNAISPISLYTDSLLNHEPDLSASARESLQTVQRAIDDVARTVARMREFYRPQEPQFHSSAVEMNSLVRQVIELTRARWSDQPQRAGIMIELRTQLAGDLAHVSGAENEIRDALMNLIFNAVDALPGGGAIEIRTGTRLLTGPAGIPTRWVQLEVSDTGIGMDEETRKRCLEPFFTTKGERGTGLGLAMVYGMAQRQRAALEIESASGRGTTVRLLFPALESARAAAEPLPQGAPTRSLRILVIDDDSLLSQSLSNALQSDGHEVTLAAGGQEGIDKFQPGHFDVVITDLGMPYVDGRQVARAIRSSSPATPIIMLTGWGRSLESEGVPPEVDRVLNKPPRLGELRAALAELTARHWRCNP
jgi:DNA-binding response OmpR family regulator